MSDEIIYDNTEKSIKNDIEDKDKDNDKDKEQLEEFIEVVKNWVKIDDDIRVKQNEIKDLKTERKDYEVFILEFMDKFNETVINITGGKIRKNKSKTKTPLKQDYIQQALFDVTQDSAKSLQMTKYILDSRPSAERVNLKRTRDRVKKKKVN